MNMPRDKEAWRAAYKARTEALERIRAWELANMTDERALEILKSLVCAEPPFRERPDWSGLVEQQVLFSRGRKRR